MLTNAVFGVTQLMHVAGSCSVSQLWARAARGAKAAADSAAASRNLEEVRRRSGRAGEDGDTIGFIEISLLSDRLRVERRPGRCGFARWNAEAPPGSPRAGRARF